MTPDFVLAGHVAGLLFAAAGLAFVIAVIVDPLVIKGAAWLACLLCGLAGAGYFSWAFS